MKYQVVLPPVWVFICIFMFLFSINTKANSWLPVQSQYILDDYEQRVTLTSPNWHVTQQFFYTHQSTKFRWEAVSGATYYELWISGSLHVVTHNEATLYYTEPDMKYLKVRACSKRICSAFSHHFQADFKRRLNVRFGTLYEELQVNRNDHISLDLLDVSNNTVEFSLDNLTWATITKSSDGKYNFPVNIARSGEHKLYIKINDQFIKPISFTVYGVIKAPVEGLHIGYVGQKDYVGQKSLVLSAPETLILHWSPSTEVAPPRTGFYRLTGERTGTIFGSAPYLKYEYGEDELHLELPFTQNGKYFMSIQACNNLESGESCGPPSMVSVFIGVDPTPYQTPTRAVTGVTVNTRIGDQSINHTVNTEPHESVFVSWETSEQVDHNEGYYIVEANGKIKAVVFDVAPYLNRRYNDGKFHIEMNFKASHNDYQVTVRACNPYDKNSGFEVNCGPKSKALTVRSIPKLKEFEAKYRNIIGGELDSTLDMVIDVNMLNGDQFEKVEANLNGEWNVISTTPNKTLSYNFGFLEIGLYTLQFRIDDYFLSEKITFEVIKSMRTLEVNNLTLNKVELDYGDSVEISWEKPSDYNRPLFYNVYIVKPSSAGIPYLWKSKLDPESIIDGQQYRVTRGPVYMRGEHKVIVTPCSAEGVCSQSNNSVTYHVGRNYIPSPEVFNVTAGTQQISVDFEWRMPVYFYGEIEASYWYKKNGSETLIAYIPNTVLPNAGEYRFYIKVCNITDVRACNTLVDTERRLLVATKPMEIYTNDGSLTWTSISTAVSYELQAALETGDTILQWHTVQQSANSAYSILDSDYGKRFRIKACISTGLCTVWSDSYLLARPIAFPSGISVDKNKLTWGEVEGATSYIVQTAKCTVTCDVTNVITWEILATINSTANLGTLNHIYSAKKGDIFRVKACFSANNCTSWSDLVVYTPKVKKIIFIHSDLLGSPVAETFK